MLNIKNGTRARLNNEILHLKEKVVADEGCINVSIFNKKTQEEHDTQMDKLADETWLDFANTLYQEMYEMEIGDLDDLSITDLVYAGTENMCSKD